MRMVALIIVVMFLLQPLACFSHPCDSCLGGNDLVDTSETSANHTHDQNTDSCDSTVCCAEYAPLDSGAALLYQPLVSALITNERRSRLPSVVIPIFIPPQNLI